MKVDQRSRGGRQHDRVRTGQGRKEPTSCENRYKVKKRSSKEEREDHKEGLRETAERARDRTEVRKYDRTKRSILKADVAFQNIEQSKTKRKAA